MNFLRSQPWRRPLNQYLASCHAETRIVSWITKPRWQIKIVNITRARLPITNVVYVFRRIHFLLIMNNKQQRVKVIVRYSVSEYVYITGGHILLVKVRMQKTWRRKFTAPPSYLPLLPFLVDETALSHRSFRTPFEEVRGHLGKFFDLPRALNCATRHRDERSERYYSCRANATICLRVSSQRESPCERILMPWEQGCSPRRGSLEDRQCVLFRDVPWLRETRSTFCCRDDATCFHVIAAIVPAGMRGNRANTLDVSATTRRAKSTLQHW